MKSSAVGLQEHWAASTIMILTVPLLSFAMSIDVVTNTTIEMWNSTVQYVVSTEEQSDKNSETSQWEYKHS